MEKQSTQRPVFRTREEINNYIAQWHESGKSKKVFCQDAGLNYMTFIGWSSKKKERQQKPTSLGSGFVQLKVKPQAKEASVFAEIRTVDGFVLRFHKEVSAAYLRNLLRP